MTNEVVVLGAGISGISAAYHLKESGIKSVVYEKNLSWGGLCDNFEIKGFRFDKFVHLSFAKDEHVKELFAKSTEYFTHIPIPYNYYKGYWLKHPAQNNLYPISEEEKEKILADFKNRKDKEASEIENYEEWLRVQYGDYFAENFPMKYTRKYWTVEAKKLETKWVGYRMYKPSLEEIKKGCETNETPLTYYIKEQRYPKNGGYKAFLNSMVEGLDIRLDKEVKEIDIENKKLFFNDGTEKGYDKLISSLPLPEMCRIVKDTPKEVLEASKELLWTSGYMVSLGFNRADIPRDIWFYIYDEDIIPARVYSPSIKSINNVPVGCSSMQAEIYFSKEKKIELSKEEILEKTIDKLIEMELFKREEIEVKDIRSVEYANIVFKPNIYENRKIVRDYLESVGIITVGRFGEWKYLWSDQSLISGQLGAEKMIKTI